MVKSAIRPGEVLRPSQALAQSRVALPHFGLHLRGAQLGPGLDGSSCGLRLMSRPK